MTHITLSYYNIIFFLNVTGGLLHLNIFKKAHNGSFRIYKRFKEEKQHRRIAPALGREVAEPHTTLSTTTTETHELYDDASKEVNNAAT